MNNKKIISLFLLMLTLVFAFSISAYAYENRSDFVTRGIVAKDIAFIFNSKEKISEKVREISYKDTNKSKWFDKYINAIEGLNYLDSYGGDFRADDFAKVKEIKKLTESLKIDYNFAGLKDDDYINYNSWNEIYRKILSELSGNKIFETFKIEEKEIVILDTSLNNNKLNENIISTDFGEISAEGFELNSLIYKKVKVFIKDNEILSIINILEDRPLIKSVFVISSDENFIQVFTGENSKKFKTAGSLRKIENKICDIKILGESAEIVKVFSDEISSTIKRVDDKIIELEDKGIINFTKEAKIYSNIDGKVSFKNISDLTVGTDIAYYTLEDGKVNAAIITKTSSPLKIRVAISNTGQTSLYHNNISLTATEDFSVTINNDTTSYESGSNFELDTDSVSDRIYIKTKTGKGKITVNSIKRNGISPSYRGDFEISKLEKGLVLVNEVNLEEYLYSVVTSEMPSSHGLEAAKVQAITARSFAYTQYYGNKFHAYGANVDDTVNSQVYNNTPENELSIEAVNLTKGMCLTYNDEVISANFFSTSAGVTANNGEVWNNSGGNTLKTSTYLSSVKQYSGTDFGDLSVESNADRFFKTTEMDSYENQFPWFRWNLELTNKEISDTINNNLSQRYLANPATIKTLQEDGTYKSVYIKSIGVLKDLNVLKRGEAGNIMELQIVGTENTIIVYSEYAIRFLIKPKKYSTKDDDITIFRKDGSTVKNYSILPSGYFTFDKVYDDEGNISKLEIFGGGNGHGVGMSQNGVKGMIDSGFDYESILKHYYQGTEIKSKI